MRVGAALALVVAAAVPVALTPASAGGEFRDEQPRARASVVDMRPTATWTTRCARRSHTGRRVFVRPGAKLAKLVEANPGGTTFCIGAGVHRFTGAVTPKPGSTFLGEPGAIFSGARDTTSLFVQAGSAWVASGMTMEGYGDPGWPNPCENGGTLCLRTNEVYYDNRFLTRVGSLAELSSGEFFFDYGADKIYIADPPAGHRVEVAVAPQSLRSFRTDALDVTVRGIVVEKFANPDHALEGKQGWVLDRVEVRLNHGCGATAPVLRNSLVHDNGICGFTGADGPVLVEGSEFYRNHRIPIICWHTASVKILRSQNGVVRDNYSHDEDCHGLWTDWDNIGTLYEGNRVERIGGPGIFHEASFDAVIRNNVVRDSGFDPRAKGWIDGSGILVNSSPNVEIYGNTVENNRHGIGATNTDRGTSPVYGVREVRNLRVHDNVIRVGKRGRSAVAAGVVGSLREFSARARFDRNRYRICAKTRFAGPRSPGSGSYAYVPWERWRSLGQDRRSTARIVC